VGACNSLLAVDVSAVGCVAVIRKAELAGNLAAVGLRKCEADAGEVEGEGVEMHLEWYGRKR